MSVFLSSLSPNNTELLVKADQEMYEEEKTSIPDQVFTGLLVIFTIFSIGWLFWFQNFGTGIPGRHSGRER